MTFIRKWKTCTLKNENEREKHAEKMEIVEHDDNGNGGIEVANAQDTILSDSEGRKSVSEERTVDAESHL